MVKRGGGIALKDCKEMARKGGGSAAAFLQDNQANRPAPVPLGSQYENPLAGTKPKSASGRQAQCAINSLLTGCPQIAAEHTLASEGPGWHSIPA